MVLAPVALSVLVGLIIGVLRHGRLASLALTRLRSLPLLGVAVGSGLVVDAFAVPRPALWAIVGLGTVANIGRELGLLSARARKRLVGEVGRALLRDRADER